MNAARRDQLFEMALGALGDLAAHMRTCKACNLRLAGKTAEETPCWRYRELDRREQWTRTNLTRALA